MVTSTRTYVSHDSLAHLCNRLVEVTERAYETKQEFQDVADQCMSFFCGGADFMWKSDYMQKYMGGSLYSRFRININKAFELVALFGPTLYWRNPTRMVNPRQKLTLPPEAFTLSGDPMAMLLMQQAAMDKEMSDAQQEMRSILLQQWLNYTPGEMPGGGLANHASSAITEALVKGRGCLWTKPYVMPGSERVLTGCFYDSVDNLLIDPDASSLADAKWIIQQVTQPIWEAERVHQLPPGSLRSALVRDFEDGRGTGINRINAGVKHHIEGKSFEQIVYYRMWSKAGCGARLSGMHDQIADSIDEIVGDYSYQVFSRGVPWLLNAHPDKLRFAEREDIAKMFRWPVPYWRDNDWPVCLLDFYPKPGTPWPIAPLAAGLGELTYINILISSLADHIYKASRMFMVTPKSLSEQVENLMKSGKDFHPLPIAEGTGRSIKDIVDFLQPPNLQTDVWRILEALMQRFDQATGMSEILYGMNPGGKQIRTAEDAALRGEMTSRRPEFMATKVEDWMTKSAAHELICTRFFIEPQDTAGILGGAEQYLWQTLINEQDPEIIFREIQAKVMANSTRRPDKQREVANINQTMQVLPQVFQQYAAVTGDFGPLNTYIQGWGEAIDFDTEGMMMQPPPPPQPQLNMPPNPQAQEAQQIQAQAMGMPALMQPGMM